jgi:hypothetical protein
MQAQRRAERRETKFTPLQTAEKKRNLTSAVPSLKKFTPKLYSTTL